MSFKQIQLYYTYSSDHLQHDNVVSRSHAKQHFEFNNALLSNTTFLKHTIITVSLCKEYNYQLVFVGILCS